MKKFASGHPREARPAADDDPTVMGMEERSAWVQAFVFVLTTVAYLAVVIPRAISQPTQDVEWVVPLLWALGLSIVAVIIGSIASGVSGAVVLTMRGQDVDTQLGTDSRDKDIGRYARLRTSWSATALALGVLVLAILDADTFWIGSFVLVMGAVGATAEAVTRIRAYRRGFIA